MSEKRFWLNSLLLAATITALMCGAMWAGWEWQKANYKEYCHARGWEFREAGGKVWCE